MAVQNARQDWVKVLPHAFLLNDRLLILLVRRSATLMHKL
jgi:hypothetical protein